MLHFAEKGKRTGSVTDQEKAITGISFVIPAEAGIQ